MGRKKGSKKKVVKTSDTAFSIIRNGSYIRQSGKCKSPFCEKDAAKYQVYCSKECAPYGYMSGNQSKKDRLKK